MCSDNTRFDANLLPDVFEDELEQESSPEATLKRRDRHDSGYVPDIGSKNFNKGNILSIPSLAVQ